MYDKIVIKVSGRSPFFKTSVIKEGGKSGLRLSGQATGQMIVGNAHRAFPVKSDRSRESATETILILEFFNRKKGEKELDVSQDATDFALR